MTHKALHNKKIGLHNKTMDCITNNCIQRLHKIHGLQTLSPYSCHPLSLVRKGHKRYHSWYDWGLIVSLWDKVETGDTNLRNATHRYTHTHRHTHTHTDTRTHTHTDTRTHTDTHKHTQTRTNTHAHAHTHSEGERAERGIILNWRFTGDSWKCTQTNTLATNQLQYTCTCTWLS